MMTQSSYRALLSLGAGARAGTGAEGGAEGSLTSVGAIRLRFSRPWSSCSDVLLTLDSRFRVVAAKLALVLVAPLVWFCPGVCGGVKSGTADDEPAAASDGTELIDGVGLFITGGGFWSGTRAKLASVAMEDADMLLAGLAGRPPTCPVKVVKGDGEAVADAMAGFEVFGRLG